MTLTAPKMIYTRLGNTGMRVSKLCLGCMSYGSSEWSPWIKDKEESIKVIKEAYNAGINFFDAANGSGGLAEIAGKPELVNDYGLSRKHISDAVDTSLKRLGVDYIDLYQIHRLDRNTPMEEIMEVLNDLVRSGKVRYIGAIARWGFSYPTAMI